MINNQQFQNTKKKIFHLYKSCLNFIYQTHEYCIDLDY